MYYNGKRIYQIVKTEKVSNLINKEIAENGTYNATDENVDGYSSVTVDVPIPEPVLQEKIVTANGEVTADKGYDGLNKVIVNVASSGSVDSGGKYLVKVIDYDGTVLKQDHLNTGATFTLPDAPTNHERLIFQEWSSPVDITDNAVTVEYQDIIIGAVYTTASGLSEFDITLTKVTGLSVTLNMNGTKNWGDGTSDTSTTHTYTDYGNYTITCDGNTMTTSFSNGLFGQSSSNKNYYCTKAFLSGITSLGHYCFNYCTSLKTITISKAITQTGGYCFYYCYILENVIIPSSLKTLAPYMFDYNYKLKTVVINNNVTVLDNYSLANCYSLLNVSIPNSITAVGTNIFQSDYNLSVVKIPTNLKNIKGSLFRNCYSIKKYDFTSCTSVPTLSDTNAFSNINAICKIYVPDALYDEWIAATNWSTFANYIYKASEMED